MKKLLFQATLVVAIGVSLASCTKNWACDCTAGELTHTSTIHNKTLKQAKDQCNSEGSVLGVDYECKVNVFK